MIVANEQFSSGFKIVQSISYTAVDAVLFLFSVVSRSRSSGSTAAGQVKRSLTDGWLMGEISRGCSLCVCVCVCVCVRETHVC